MGVGERQVGSGNVLLDHDRRQPAVLACLAEPRLEVFGVKPEPARDARQPLPGCQRKVEQGGDRDPALGQVTAVPVQDVAPCRPDRKGLDAILPGLLEIGLAVNYLDFPESREQQDEHRSRGKLKLDDPKAKRVPPQFPGPLHLSPDSLSKRGYASNAAQAWSAARKSQSPGANTAWPSSKYSWMPKSKNSCAR